MCDNRCSCQEDAGTDQQRRWRSCRSGSDARASRTRRTAHSGSEARRSQLKHINMCSELGHWTYTTVRTPVKDATAGRRNDLTLASSPECISLSSRGYRPYILRQVAYFEAEVGFGSVAARLSTWDDRHIGHNLIVDKICGSNAKLICLHTKRRAFFSVYQKGSE